VAIVGSKGLVVSRVRVGHRAPPGNAASAAMGEAKGTRGIRAITETRATRVIMVIAATRGRRAIVDFSGDGGKA